MSDNMTDNNVNNNAAKVTDDTTDKTTLSIEEQLSEWKQFARKWEDRAKSNEQAAEELQALKDAQKSELQKLTERAERAEAALQEASHKVMVADVAAKFNLSAEDAALFLTGKDEETVTAQAKALSARLAAQEEQKVESKTVIPGQTVRDGAPVISDDQMLLQQLLGIR